MESLALIRAGKLKGAIAALPERLTDKSGNLRAWLLGGPSPGAFTIKNIGGFDITDVAGLPDGGLILLERRFRYSEGVQMRIRRIRAEELVGVFKPVAREADSGPTAAPERSGPG